MSFAKILEKKGIYVKLIRITKTNEHGYLTESEEITQVKMVILPLSKEEKLFWSNAGIVKAEMKAFTDQDVRTGWQVEINGKRYKIRAYENYGEYKKLILEAIS